MNLNTYAAKSDLYNPTLDDGSVEPSACAAQKGVCNLCQPGAEYFRGIR